MADPVLTFEIALTSAPGAAVPTWTDLSVYLRSASTRRGRAQDLERFMAGEAEFVLGNEDRRFDPAYAAGPYYGNVVPMKRVRLTAVYAAVTYPIFDGYIDSWEQAYEHPGEALAIVKATDAFKVLAAADLPSSAYALEALVDVPVAWWRLGEAAGATLAIDSVGTANLTVAGAGVVFGQTGLVSRETDGAVEIIGTTPSVGDGLSRYGPTVVSTAPLTLEVVFQYLGPNVGSGNLLTEYTGTGGQGVQLAIQAGTGVALWGVTTAAGSAALSGTTDLRSGAIYHVAGVWEAGGTIRLYVNGVAEGGTSTLTPAALPANTFIAIGGASGVDGPDGVYDEAAVYASALSAARIAAHATARTTPWNSDTPSGRVTRVLDYLAWPAGLRDLDTGASVLQSATLAENALEHLQKVADSEFGALFISRDGKVTLVERSQMINQTSQATFGDLDPEWEYTELDFDYSDADIRNDVTVSRLEGTAQRAQDATSIAAYLRHSFTMDGLLYDNDTLSLDAAAFFVALGKDPKLRVTQMRVEPVDGTNAALFAEALERELTEWVTVRRRPQNLGAVIEQVCEVEGIDHTLAAKVWQTTFRLSPARVPSGTGACFIQFDDGAGSAPCGFDDFAFAF